MTPRKPFNVTRIHPAGYVHARALEEAMEYLHAMLVACGYRAQHTVNVIDGGCYNVVACAHLLGAEHVAGFPRDTIIFNSERLVEPTDWPLASTVYRGALDTFHVWDYSARNLTVLGHDRASVIPFLYCEELVRPFPREPGTALLFYGAVTPHRRRLLAELEARGVVVETLFGAYGAERDRQIASALAVLNLHKLADPTLFEPIRCFHPLIQGCPVISEDTDDPTAAPFRDAMFWVGPQAFAAEVARLVADRAAWSREADARVRRFAARSPGAAILAAVEAFLARSADR